LIDVRLAVLGDTCGTKAGSCSHADWTLDTVGKMFDSVKATSRHVSDQCEDTNKTTANINAMLTESPNRYVSLILNLIMLTGLL